MPFIPRSLVLGLALATATASSLAAPVSFFGENLSPSGGVSGAPVSARNSFLANLTGVSTETFESFAPGTDASSGPLSLVFTGSLHPTITASLSGNGIILSSTSSVNGRYNTTAGGSKWWDTDGFFDLDFDNPISAFGFYGTDIGDFGGRITLQLTDTGNNVTTLTTNNTTPASNGALLFFGFIDSTTSYKKIGFGNTSVDMDGFGFDSMVVGDRGQITPSNGVPEPGSLALVGLALAAAGLYNRRSRPL